MYYELTKEKYKEYNRKFKKTYVGKGYYLGYLLFYIVAIFLLAEIQIMPIVDSTYITTSIELTDLCILLLVPTLFIGGVMIELQYRKELKEYIKNEK